MYYLCDMCEFGCIISLDKSIRGQGSEEDRILGRWKSIVSRQLPCDNVMRILWGRMNSVGNFPSSRDTMRGVAQERQ